jgi:hypothetical protein
MVEPEAAGLTVASSLPPLYVVYKHPRDHPGQYVVRRWAWERGSDESAALRGTAHALPGYYGGDFAPLAVTRTLAEARRALPTGLVNIGRDVNDDPVIAEVWV